MTPKGVPMLRYRQSNFHVFKDALSTECHTKYGSLGKLIEMGRYYKEKMPGREDYVLSQDPEDNKILFIDTLKG